MRSRFSTKWTKHLRTDAEKEQLEKTIRASRTALDRIKQIIEEEVESLNNQEASLTDYTDASWSHKQAHRNGQRAMAKSMIDLLSFTRD